jgi:hypothetical protein
MPYIGVNQLCSVGLCFGWVQAIRDAQFMALDTFGRIDQ